MNNNNNLTGLDIISLFGTLLGVLNYQENLSQNDFLEATENQTQDLHNHLIMQDKKIDKIIEALEVLKNENH